MTEKHVHHGRSSKDILSAGEVLKATGLKMGDTFLDAGSGDGYISIEASNIVGDSGKIFALDVYPESIEILKKDIEKRDLNNIEPIVADIIDTIPLEENSIDNVLLANVLHGFIEGGEVSKVMANINKVLKPAGIFTIVEFRKLENKIGPPFNVRLFPYEVINILKDYGFEIEDNYEIGDYHYIVRCIKHLD